MSIDFSQVVTAEDKARAEARAHAAQVKAECHRRICAVLPLETQQNLVQAMLAGAEEPLPGPGHLDREDRALVMRGWQWIAAMRAAHRGLAADPLADPAQDAAWPEVPPGLHALAARF